MSETQVPNGSPIPAAPEVLPTPAPRKASKPKPQRKPEAGVRYIPLSTGDAKEFARLVLPTSDADPRWDPRLGLKLEKEFILDIAENGVEVDVEVTPDPTGLPKGVQESYPKGSFGINDGRMRVRAIPEANAIRKKKGLPPLEITLKVREREDVAAMRAAVRLNEKRRESDAVTRARNMSRMLDTGLTDSEIASDYGMTPQQVQTHLSLLSLPEEVQDMVVRGKLSVTTAAGIAKLDPKEIRSKANALIAAGESGARVTAKAAARATGTSDEPDRMPAKAVKVLIQELKAAKLAGKHGEVVVKAAVYALETYLDARKKDGLWDRLDKLAKG